MASWFDSQFSSHRSQLALTAVVSGAVAMAAVMGVQSIRHKMAVEQLKASIPNVEENVEAMPNFDRLPPRTPATSKEDGRAAELAARAQKGDYDDELINEQLTRTASFLTPKGLEKLRSSFVVVVGLGGVGSHCTTALARSGVSHLRVIDFDQVTLSSLNRHAVATLADVGIPKVACVRKRLEAIVPWVKWECFNEVWREDQAERLLAGNPDYVIDAIDNIDSKVALLKYCYEHGIKVISAMGAGCKSDPTKIGLEDISASTEDPLSKSTRRRLRQLGISTGIPVVFSTEKPGPGKATLLPLPEDEFQKGKVGELSVLPDFRARILPVLGTMPAAFGYTLANWVILEISGYPHELSPGKFRDATYDKVLQELQSSEERLVRSEGKADDAYGLRIPISRDDVGYLLDEVYRGKSVISGLATRTTLVRWRSSPNGYMPEVSVEGQKVARLELSDLVCMTREEANKQEKKVLIPKISPDGVYSADVVGRVERRQQEEQQLSRYR